ncbi:MAG: hypothetical protein IPK13_21070 [Deltaproteobacteria bacterium]|nr:hypothetical protein [Deltaproteobacteria bacterium]
MGGGSRHTAIVRRTWKETERLEGAVLEVEPELAARYVRPGQVVTLSSVPGGEKVYLALASFPGERFALEVLLGAGAQQKLTLSVGQELEISEPFGAGFPLDRASGREILIFAVGSAIASVRPLIEHFRRDRGQYGRIRAYLGAHTTNDFPYRAEYFGWSSDQVEVIQSISRPYVQDRFRADSPPASDAMAYVSGMKAMVQGCTEALTESGFSPDRIGRNW